MSLKLYNTLTRKKEVFKPVKSDNVRMYVCGPTVYDHAHIGNARPVIVFDVLFRLLRHIYGAEQVTYVRNITDVDDKINARAAQEGVSIGEITARTTKQFHEDIDALGVLPPSIEPRATDHIAGMITMIKTLIERGHAYAADGHVLFSVSSDKSYGCLSNRSSDEMLAGARVDVASYKKDPMDFVLWKPSPQEARSGAAATGKHISLPGWDSPWGRGRPGWHIECSVMSEKYLGEVFDIHGGGLDLIFPHHENEIAQSTCAHGNPRMANYWVHNGYLQVEGEKMSKSLGNFITIHELLKEWPGEVLRFNMLRTHYRQPIDWTVQGLKESAATLEKWFSLASDEKTNGLKYLNSAILEALLDDLNTPQAIAALHQLFNKGDGQALGAALRMLGFKGNLADPRTREADSEIINRLIDARLKARSEKNWTEADRIRDELDAMDIVLKDGPEGTTWEIRR